jgi:hypothetical protein
MSKHRVRLHKWENGVLKSITHFFDSIDEAVDFANTADAHGAKIYNDSGELVSAINPAVVQGPEHAYT